MADENSTEEHTDADENQAGSDGKFTQEQMTQRATTEKRQGREAGKRQLLKDLGFDDEESARAAVTAHREAQDREKSEAEKEREQAAKEKTVAAEEKRQARTERYEARVERALLREGCSEKIIERVTRLVDLDYAGDNDVPAMEDILEAVQSLKKEMPQLFSSNTTEGDGENGQGSNKDSDAGRPPGSKKAEKTAKERGQERLAKYQTTHAAPMESYDDLTQT